MQYFVPVILLALFALLGLAIALRLLWPGRWWLGWLRGSAGLLLLWLAVLAALGGRELASYRVPAVPQGWLQLEVSAADDGYHLQLQGAENRALELRGELWQLEVRAWRWGGVAELIGLQPGYRIQALSGRYLDFESRGSGSRESLHEVWAGVDPWASLAPAGGHAWAQAELLRSPWLPLRDGARYGVSLTPAGMLVQPLNEVALHAMERWQQP